MYRTVLVPLDGSAFGEHALPLALSIARRAGAKLQLVYVHTPLTALYGDGIVYRDESLEAYFEKTQQNYLEGVAKRLGSVCRVPVATLRLEGEIAATIGRQAVSGGADLVVMTTHARGPLGRFWLGSVADELVRSLPGPLLLVRPGEGTPDLTREPILKHILLPLDGSTLAEQIIEPAIALGRLMNADYTLLRVIHPVLPASCYLEGTAESHSLHQSVQSVLDKIARMHKELQVEAQAYLDLVAQRLRAQSLFVQTRIVAEEQPAAAILHEAMGPGCDLVALETHGRRGLARLIRGSVAEKVLRSVSQPMLVHCPTEK